MQLSLYIPDFESKLMIDALPNIMPIMPTGEVEKVESYLRDRNEMVKAGMKRCPSWFMEELMELDPHLRCWWDSWKEEWVIDRFQNEGIVEGLLRLAETESADFKSAIRNSATGLLQEGKYYLTVMHFKPEGELQLNRALIQNLRSCDMQRYSSPAEYLAEKRRKADAIEEANKRSGNDVMLSKIDAMTDKQVHTFVEASQALADGDAIHCHGDDAKFMQGIEDARKQAPPMVMPRPIHRKKVRR